MNLLMSMKRAMELIMGACDYTRYCEHLRLRHPDLRRPTEKEFYLSRLNEKYSRPSRCC